MSDQPVTAIGILSASKIGEKTGFVDVPFQAGENTLLDYAITGYYHVHGEAFTYPGLANPVQLTSAAAAWAATGAKTEIIPANAITKPFDLHWIQVSDISIALYGLIELFSGPSGAEVKISDIPIFRTSNFISEGNMRIQIPQQVANARISARFSDSTTSARTCSIKLLGHVYG